MHFGEHLLRFQRNGIARYQNELHTKVIRSEIMVTDENLPVSRCQNMLCKSRISWRIQNLSTAINCLLFLNRWGLNREVIYKAFSDLRIEEWTNLKAFHFLLVRWKTCTTIIGWSPLSTWNKFFIMYILHFVPRTIKTHCVALMFSCSINPWNDHAWDNKR